MERSMQVDIYGGGERLGELVVWLMALGEQLETAEDRRWADLARAAGVLESLRQALAPPEAGNRSP